MSASRKSRKRTRNRAQMPEGGTSFTPPPQGGTLQLYGGGNLELYGGGNLETYASS